MCVFPVHRASSTQRLRPATHVNLWRRRLTCGNWQLSPVSRCWPSCWLVLRWSSGSWCIDANHTNDLYVNPLKKLRDHFIKLKTAHLIFFWKQMWQKPQSDWLRARRRNLWTMNCRLWLQGEPWPQLDHFNLLDCWVERRAWFSLWVQWRPQDLQRATLPPLYE